MIIVVAAVATCLLALVVFVSYAPASVLVDRNATHVMLRVSGGVATVSYRTRAGRSWHVRYWGAKNNALRLRHVRAAGIGGRTANACGPYRGPALQHVVRACTARDGSHWVLQSWQRIVPNYGGLHGTPELRVSHFTGAVAVLWAKTDWSWNGRFEHLYGQLTYLGGGVYGKSVRPDGYVLDGRGRNVTLDSLSSDYPGSFVQWRRVNAFLANRPNGQFCFGFAPKGGSPFTGRSRVQRYRMGVAGPGVSPDVFTTVTGHATYDAALEAQANFEQAQVRGGATGGSCATIN